MLIFFFEEGGEKRTPRCNSFLGVRAVCRAILGFNVMGGGGERDAIAVG